MKPTTSSLAIISLLALGVNAQAQSPILDFTGGSAGSPVSDTIAGVQFLVSNSININALGIWDEGADGLAHSHDVGLWNSTGSLLIASTTVTNAATSVASTSADGRWLAVLVGNITLTPGTYVLGATFLNRDADLARLSATSSGISGVTFSNALQQTNTSVLTFPTQNSSNVNAGSFGPNAFLLPSSVPEPGSVGLFVGMGLTGAFTFMRRRCRK